MILEALDKDELDKIVEDMTDYSKIGYLTEICVLDFMKKMEIATIKNWFLASHGKNDSSMVAINIRCKGEEESAIVRDTFLKNHIPILSFVYDFSKNSFEIYEETWNENTPMPITKDTMYCKYRLSNQSKSNKQNEQNQFFESTSVNIPELSNSSYTSFIKSLSEEEIKDFYISKNAKIKELIFNHFEKIIDLDFCYIKDGKLWIVDVKEKECKRSTDTFIFNKGESVYYSKILNFEGVGVQFFVVKHDANRNERETFVKNMINKKEYFPSLYIKNVTKNWIYSGKPDIIGKKNVLKYPWEKFTYYDTQWYIDRKEIQQAIDKIPNGYEKCVAYLLKDVYLFLVGKHQVLEALEQLKKKKPIFLNEKKVIFVPRKSNKDRENWNVFLTDQQRNGIANGMIDIAIFYEVDMSLLDAKQFKDCFKIIGYADKDTIERFYFIGKKYAFSQTNFNKIKNGLSPIDLSVPEREKDMYFFDTKNDPFGLPKDYESILY